MKGNNELRLNEATMIEAVQEWLKYSFKATVVSVNTLDENGQRWFKIGLEEQKVLEK